VPIVPGVHIVHTQTLHDSLRVGEVPRGEKTLYSGTDPESYIIEYTLVYEDDSVNRRPGSLTITCATLRYTSSCRITTALFAEASRCPKQLNSARSPNPSFATPPPAAAAESSSAVLSCLLAWRERFGVQVAGCRVQGSGCKGFRVQGSRFRVQGAGFRVQGSGFDVAVD